MTEPLRAAERARKASTLYRQEAVKIAEELWGSLNDTVDDVACELLEELYPGLLEHAFETGLDDRDRLNPDDEEELARAEIRTENALFRNVLIQLQRLHDGTCQVCGGPAVNPNRMNIHAPFWNANIDNPDVNLRRCPEHQLAE